MDFLPQDIAAVSRAIQSLPSKTENTEIEFRLGSIRGAFDPSINHDLFLRIMSGLRTNPSWSKIEMTHTIDYVAKDGLRVTHDVKTGTWSAMTKKRLSRPYTMKHQGGKLDVRVSISEETPRPMPPTPPLSTIVREKKRTSFFHKFWRYDMTEVRSATEEIDEDRDTTYEIEVELTDISRIVQQPDDYIEYIVRFGLMICQDIIRLSGM